MSKAGIAFCATIIALSLLTACSAQQHETSQAPMTTGQPASESALPVSPGCSVAVTFINAYTVHCQPGAERTPDSAWVANNVLLTKSFKASYQKLRDDAYKANPELGLDFDPIFDAQDFPDSGFVLVTCDADSGYVLVRGKEWPDFKVLLRVVAQGNRWLVDGAGVINISDEKRLSR